MLKQIISGVLVLAVTVGSVSAAAESGPSSWAEGPVAEAISLQFVPEELQGNYQAAITRAEFTQIAVLFLMVQYGYDHVDDFIDDYCLVRPDREGREFSLENYLDPNQSMSWYYLFGYQPDDLKTAFQDARNHPLQLYINTACAFGLVNGTSASTFTPDAPITRQEAAAMLARVYRNYGGTVPEYGTENPFTDAGEIAGWAMADVQGITALQVMEGVGEGRFAPLEYYTREQCITTFLRLCQDAPVNRAQGNLDYLFTYEEQLERVVSLNNSELFYELERLEAPACTVIYGYREGRHGTYYELNLVYRERATRDVLADLPTHPWSGSFAAPFDLLLSEDGTALTFSIKLKNDATVEFQTVWEKGLYHYRVDLLQGTLTQTAVEKT